MDINNINCSIRMSSALHTLPTYTHHTHTNHCLPANHPIPLNRFVLFTDVPPPWDLCQLPLQFDDINNTISQFYGLFVEFVDVPSDICDGFFLLNFIRNCYFLYRYNRLEKDTYLGQW